MKILLVDDDPSTLDALSRMLMRMRFTVVTACDGAEALNAFRTQGDFDAVITDTDMPSLDGHQLVAAIRKICLRIPIIRLSGRTDNQAPNGDHFRFALKPINRDQLLGLMAELGVHPPAP